MPETRSILHVADYAPTYSGNFVASLRLAAAECRARGFKMVWVFPSEVQTFRWFQDLAEESHCTVHLLPRTENLWRLSRRIAKLAIAENAVIVHTHFCRFDIAAWLARVQVAALRQPFHLVWHVHSAFGPETDVWRKLKDQAKLRLMGRFCHAVPVSAPLGDDLQARGFPAHRIRVIQNGIDLTHATARRRTRAEVRRSLKIPEHTRVLLGFGWTPVRKGVDTMLRALAELNQDGAGHRLLLVGTSELAEFISAWPDRAAIRSVTILPPEEFVADLFAASDVFLSPSRAEGWCYAVAESIANGVPAASSWIPAVSWAKDAPGVWFSEPEDSAGLATSIRKILALTQQERLALAEQARDFIQSRHSVEHWGRTIWEFYADLINWNEPPRGRTTVPAS